MSLKKFLKLKNRTNEKGMSLVEIMIVIVILGSLGAYIANKIFGKKDKATYDQTRQILFDVAQTLEMYKADCNRYPSALEYLTKSPGDEECANWGPGAYTKNQPKDAWGRELDYTSDGASYTLRSFGADGKEGGDGYSKDITYEP